MHTIAKKSSLFIIVAALVLPLLQVFIPAGRAAAASVSFTWINRSTLIRTTDKHLFVDPDISDSTHQYFEVLPATDTSGCKSMLDVLTSGTSPLSAPDSYDYYEATLNNNQLNKSCSNGDYSSVTQHFAGDAFGNAPVQATYIYYWKDKQTIARLNVGNLMNDKGTNVSIPASTYSLVGTYSSTGTNIYREGGDCPDEIAINGSGNLTNESFTARSTQTGSNAVGVHLNNNSDRATMVDLSSTKTAAGCYEGKTTVVVTMQAYATSDPSSGGNPITGATNGGSTGDAVSSNDSCYKALPVFGWILCGVIDLADSAFSSLRSFIFDLLNIPSAEIGSSSQLKATWSVMKNLATAGLVLVAVVMVASQIFSFDFMSAYTIKKVLPRLVIAAVAMQFSWFIFTLLIQISNAAGAGIYSLLINAFGAQDIMDIVGAARGGGATATAGAVTVIGTIGATVAGFSAVGLFLNGGALMVVFTMLGVLISILVALFTLIVRFMLIVILLVISPLALLAWILPGTQNLWQTWWRLFSRLLAMYALIAVLFAAGAIGAKVAIGIGLMNGQSGGLALIAAIVMYFAPLFLVPSTFKFAGGMFTTATNMLNKMGDKAKNGGYLGTRARAKESYQHNKKEKGLELANTPRTGLRGQFDRRRGRIMAGTAGATGAYARQLRGSEREGALKHASTQISEDIKELGIIDYDDQLDYRVALAKGESTYKGRDGKTYEVRSYGSSGQQAAVMALAESGKADRVREVKASLYAHGLEGEKIWSDAMETHAGKVVSVAADAVGKPFETLRASEMATQDPGSLRNMAREYEEAVAAGNTEKAQKLINIADELRKNDTLYGQVNQDGKAFVDYVASGGTAGGVTPPPALSSEDYKGHTTERQVKGMPKGTKEPDPEFSGVPTMKQAEDNAKNKTGKF